MAKDEILQQLKGIIKELEETQAIDKDVIRKENEKPKKNETVIGKAEIQRDDCKWVISRLSNIINIYSCINN